MKVSLVVLVILLLVTIGVIGFLGTNLNHMSKELDDLRAANHTLQTELLKKKELKNFDSVASLLAWLEKDKTDTDAFREKYYSETAIRLQQAGFAGGYAISIAPIVGPSGLPHLINAVIVEANSKYPATVFYIDPTRDEIEAVFNLGGTGK